MSIGAVHDATSKCNLTVYIIRVTCVVRHTRTAALLNFSEIEKCYTYLYGTIKHGYTFVTVRIVFNVQKFK